MVKITKENQILFFPTYKKADAAEADLWFRSACELKFCISQDGAKWKRLVPSFDKFAWSAEVRQLPSDSLKSNKITPVILFHSILHALISEAFGYELKGFRKMCILSEAMSSASGLYFALLVSGNVGLNAATKATVISFYESSGKILARDWISNFNELQKTPFEAYKEFVRYLITFIDLSSGLAKGRIPTDRPRQLIQKSKKLFKSPFFIYAHKLDFGNFLLYMNLYCGKESKQKDLEKVKACLKLLDQAESMSEFLILLRKKSGFSI